MTRSGAVVLLDDDLELPGRLSIGSHGYPQVTGVKKGVVVLLHRWLMGLQPGDRRMVDHINRKPRDCRRANLRIVTPTQNNLNRELRERDMPRHVYRARSGRYVVSIKRYRSQRHVGTYDTVEDAVEARDLVLAVLAGQAA